MSNWALGAYGALTTLAQPLLRLKLWWRGRREPVYRHAVAERFGCAAGDGVRGRVWLHAVSLGETRAAQPLLQALRAAQPGLRVLLTHATATGRSAGLNLLRDGDAQSWLPWDAPACVARFLALHQPRALLLMETEVWPVLIDACQRAGVPVVLLNARLSERSLRRALRLAALARPAYAGLAMALAQTEADADRLRMLGVSEVRVMGNLKFDLTPDAAQWARGRAWREPLLGRRVLMLASSREGEEAAWLQALRRVADRGHSLSQALWLVVPRHPQRFDEVELLLRQTGLRVWRRSHASAAGALPEAALQAQVWLGDSLGEMPSYYGLADLALLGGSFAELGGQNLIEALACDCPVLMGPHTFNFADVAHQAERVGAAVRVRDMEHALHQAALLLASPAALEKARQAAAELLTRGRGAGQRQAQAVLEQLASPSS